MAMAELRYQRPRWGIIELDGQEAGIFQVLETGFCANMLHTVILDRGPLWFENFGKIEHFQLFMECFRKHYPRRPGRAVRVIPEMNASPEIDVIMKHFKFRKKSAPYQTLDIDLTLSPDNLRANLRKNWRTSLNKAEKAGLSVDWDTKGLHLDWLLKFYAFDQKTKGYKGPSVELIRALADHFVPHGQMMIGRAKNQAHHVIAAILLFSHGRGSTYQIGWNSQEGRNLGAHNLLLWQALLCLKDRGVTHFDLGGVNDTEAQNVKSFKQGMGGRLVTLAGLYT